jgi:hypothetical protein
MAARYPTAYYGQLARAHLELGDAAVPTLPIEPVSEGNDAASYQRSTAPLRDDLAVQGYARGNAHCEENDRQAVMRGRLDESDRACESCDEQDDVKKSLRQRCGRVGEIRWTRQLAQ